MYKMIVSDLDETLLRADGSISDSNIAAIKAATARGIKFVPNTGRNYLTVQPLLETLGLLNQPDEYVISYNGGAIVENAGNQVLATNGMLQSEAQKVFDVMRAFPETDVHVYTLTNLYIYRLRADDQAYLKTRGVPFSALETTDLGSLAEETIIKVIAMNPSANVQTALFQAVNAAFEGQINCTYSSGIYVEANHYGVDKGTATIELGDRLGISPAEIIAIGDNANDLPMLRRVGMPVAVANGIPEVQAVAKLVTTADYESGVAEAIEKLVLSDN
ncbi:HAD family hydrolase [uncultured Secundilactobacillus sp.]|uniref:HAD family hydrolase n=1 Tax=uncultured Secundilactobacillus sp. TaxID=2813935 RepID=UPI00258755D6|nr:HAD family hydrolase [uncultured Secundilactobacillus sp.]